MVSLGGFRQWLKLRNQEMEVRNVAVGMNSSLDWAGDLHIVMLDYDIPDVSMVKDSVRELQEFWKLADAEIFKTTNGFHVFFWYDHVPYERLQMIINYAKYVDPMFKYIGRYYDHKTIRVAGKYRHRDIVYEDEIKSLFAQPVTSTTRVRELGDLKRKEHKLLRGA